MNEKCKEGISDLTDFMDYGVDFYKVMNLDDLEIEQYDSAADTIGGFITESEGRILKKGEVLSVGQIKLTIEESDQKRIKMVKALKS